MKRKILILGFISLSYLTAFCQISIEDCYTKAQANYPLIKQFDLIEKTKGYNLSNANKGYLPQVMFSGKMSYQSDVTKMPFNPSSLGIDVPTLSKDQYGASLDINQTIWDGGIIKSQKDGLNTAAKADQKSIDVDIYAINERVNQLYFGILLTQGQINQNKLLQDELDRNYNQVLSYVENGIANKSDLDAIQVDRLRTKQIEVQLIHTRKAYTEMLSVLIGEELTVNTKFIKPAVKRSITNTINRPELDLFDAKIRNLETRNNEITSSLMPKLGAFVTVGYGKPGLNMFNNNFEPYSIAGLKLSWNIGSFYTKKNNRRSIQTSIESIENQRDVFLFNTKIDIIQKNTTIDSYFDQLKYDDEIIALRTSIKEVSEIKMANGTISGTDLIQDINAEQMAIQDKILHETELLLAIYNLKFVTNN